MITTVGVPTVATTLGAPSASSTAAEARSAFQKSLFISTCRCTLMYIVFPFVLPAALRLHLGDASVAPIADASCDLVLQSTVFSSLLDDAFQQRLAHRGHITHFAALQRTAVALGQSEQR